VCPHWLRWGFSAELPHEAQRTGDEEGDESDEGDAEEEADEEEEDKEEEEEGPSALLSAVAWDCDPASRRPHSLQPRDTLCPAPTARRTVLVTPACARTSAMCSIVIIWLRSMAVLNEAVSARIKDHVSARLLRKSCVRLGPPTPSTLEASLAGSMVSCTSASRYIGDTYPGLPTTTDLPALSASPDGAADGNILSSSPRNVCGEPVLARNQAVLNQPAHLPTMLSTRSSRQAE